MKTKIFIGVIVLLFTASYSHAQSRIWRINNDDASADYADLDEAVNDNINVVSGDTLYLEGSAIEYSGATLTKRLTIMGPGYFLAENPQTPANTSSAIIGERLIFSSGSEGSKLMGVEFDGVSNRPNINVSNITVMRCRLPSGVVFFRAASGARIIQNYLESIYPSTSNVTDLIIQNNIFTGFVDLDDAAVSICENNVFTAEGLFMNASFFRNNILTVSNLNIDRVDVISSNFQNNLAPNGEFGMDNGNQTVSIEDVFIGPDEGSTDGQWQLKEGSPAIGAGVDGVDCGAFGGNNPYVLSGLPNIPIIYDLRTEGIGDAETGLPVQIKVKMN